MTKRQNLAAGVSLVLLASLVVGSENRRREAPPDSPQAPARVVPPPQAHQEAAEELEVEKLQRPKRSETIVDVFAHRAPPVGAPVPAPTSVIVLEPPAPPPPPTAPPLPFRLVGKFVEDGAMRLLLANGEKEHNVSGGETLEGVYRVDSVSADSVVFTYLPLNTAQTLQLTADPAR